MSFPNSVNGPGQPSGPVTPSETPSVAQPESSGVSTGVSEYIPPAEQSCMLESRSVYGTNYAEISNQTQLRNGDILLSLDYQLDDPAANYSEYIVDFEADPSTSEVLAQARQIGERGRQSGRSYLEIAKEVARPIETNFNPGQGRYVHRAALLQMALQEAGVPSRYVQSTIVGRRHAWVEIDVHGNGRYSYVIDPNIKMSGWKTQLRHTTYSTIENPSIEYRITENGRISPIVYEIEPQTYNLILRNRSQMSRVLSRPQVYDLIPPHRGSVLPAGMRGFAGQFLTMFGLEQIDAWIGLHKIPFVRILAGITNLYAGHVVGTSISTGVGMRVAATHPRSLLEFFKGGGRFLTIMPFVLNILNRMGITPERLGNIFGNFAGNVAFTATAIGSTLAAERVAMRVGARVLGFLEKKGATRLAGLLARIGGYAIPGLAWGLVIYEAIKELPHLIDMIFENLPEVNPEHVGAKRELAKRIFKKCQEILRDRASSESDKQKALAILLSAGNSMPEGSTSSIIFVGRANEINSALVDEVEVEMNLELWNIGREIRTAVVALLHQAVSMDFTREIQDLDGDTYSPNPSAQYARELLEDRILSVLYTPDLPDGIAGNAIDNDCDAGESACLDPIEQSEIYNYEKMKGMILAGNDLLTIRGEFNDPAEFELALNQFFKTMFDALTKLHFPFEIEGHEDGGNVFEDGLQQAIRDENYQRIINFIIDDQFGDTSFEDYFNKIDLSYRVTRMTQLLQYAEEADGKVVIPPEAGIVTQEDIEMGLVESDYVIDTQSPSYTAIEAIVVAQLEENAMQERLVYLLSQTRVEGDKLIVPTEIITDQDKEWGLVRTEGRVCTGVGNIMVCTPPEVIYEIDVNSPVFQTINSY